MLHLRCPHELLLQSHRKLKPVQFLRLAHQLRKHLRVVRRRECGVGEHLECRALFAHQLQYAPECNGRDIVVCLRLAPLLEDAAHPRQPCMPLAVEQKFVEPCEARALIGRLVCAAQQQLRRFLVGAEFFQHTQQ